MIDRLTPREREVVIACALGNTQQETADRLAITRQTVKNHLGTAIKKYGARNSHDLIYKLGWFDPDPEVHPSTAARPTHNPGDAHEYDLICRVCGTAGVIRLLIDPPVAS